MKKAIESILEATRVFFGGQPDCKCLSAEAYNLLITTPQDKLPVELLPFISGANVKVHVPVSRVKEHCTLSNWEVEYDNIFWRIADDETRYWLDWKGIAHLGCIVEFRTIRDYGHIRRYAIIYTHGKVSS